MGGINVTLFINKKNSQDIEFNVVSYTHLDVYKRQIEHNPMGGINVTLFINKKNSQDIEFNVIKKEGKLLLEGVDLSGDLSKRIKEKGYE
ncbi:DUF1310 family protein [Enterococcus sp. 10F3_DIV0382]|uniref:DUF1310 family protein n=1 Tax=Enterococcus sp. 10F3_DIV0382 TaxID=1834165 RepID=UPI000B70F3C6|nr:DUF1310 family protein [Enterococcus sp. 10F3_DIV0382]OTO88914.1 hypothetical protein A5849_000820 [Enterococcus sp. 10F3_DIV0382]